MTLFRALDVALELLFEEGLERAFARHALLARAARAGIEALGLERFGPDDENANVVTVARLPDEIDGAQVPKLMRDRYGVTIAGGQGHLKGKIARIAHCGYYGAFDIVVALTALEMALRDLGHDAEPGSGAGAAQRVFAEAGEMPRRRSVAEAKPKVLVKEKIADSGVELLRADFDVELGLEMSDGELERANRRVRRDRDPVGHQADRGPDRARLEAEGDRPRRDRASTTSTWTRPPSAASWSSTPPSRTRSPPPSTRWRWLSPCAATSPRRTPRWSGASGRGRDSPATSCTARRSA